MGAAFKAHGLLAIPVVDTERGLQGIFTLDDVLDVRDEEATEDMQKAGGMELPGAPYLEVSLPTMVWKRAGWLAALFLGEMLTATARQAVRPIYGEHYLRLELTVGLSLVGVVTLGTFAGSLLPLGPRAARLDPASASGPIVATVANVAELVICFTIAGLMLGGLLA